MITCFTKYVADIPQHSSRLATTVKVFGRKSLLRAAIISISISIPFIYTEPASAQFVDRNSDEPLDITSDRLESQENIATWIGDVRAVQGDSILTTERLILIRKDDGNLDRIEAVGTVRFATAEEAITGDKAIYRDLERTITMTGEVVVTQGKQILTGGDLIYWVDTGRIEFKGDEGQRIRGIFETKDLDNQS
ncbi:MAG: LptA/OstA family protein [Pseudomonadota bacterium]